MIYTTLCMRLFPLFESATSNHEANKLYQLLQCDLFIQNKINHNAKLPIVKPFKSLLVQLCDPSKRPNQYDHLLVTSPYVMIAIAHSPSNQPSVVGFHFFRFILLESEIVVSHHILRQFQKCTNLFLFSQTSFGLGLRKSIPIQCGNDLSQESGLQREVFDSVRFGLVPLIDRVTPVWIGYYVIFSRYIIYTIKAGLKLKLTLLKQNCFLCMNEINNTK